MLPVPTNLQSNQISHLQTLNLGQGSYPESLVGLQHPFFLTLNYFRIRFRAHLLDRDGEESEKSNIAVTASLTMWHLTDCCRSSRISVCAFPFQGLLGYSKQREWLLPMNGGLELRSSHVTMVDSAD